MASKLTHTCTFSGGRRRKAEHRIFKRNRKVFLEKGTRWLTAKGSCETSDTCGLIPVVTDGADCTQSGRAGHHPRPRATCLPRPPPVLTRLPGLQIQGVCHPPGAGRPLPRGQTQAGVTRTVAALLRPSRNSDFRPQPQHPALSDSKVTTFLHRTSGCRAPGAPTEGPGQPPELAQEDVTLTVWSQVATENLRLLLGSEKRRQRATLRSSNKSREDGGDP